MFLNRKGGSAPSDAASTSSSKTDSVALTKEVKNTSTTPLNPEVKKPIDENARSEMRRLSIGDQKQRMIKELERWNTGFNGSRENAFSLTPAGQGTLAVAIEAEGLSNLTPLRALPELVRVSINAKGKPVDLKGLAGLSLTGLDCKNASVDLQELGAMKTLQQLDLSGSKVAHLDRLPAFSLTSLALNDMSLDNLDSLQQVYMLRRLEIRGLPITTLDELKNHQIEYLDFSDCAGVTKIDVLEKMPLTSIRCSYKPGFGRILKQHPTLTMINGMSREEFFNKN